MASNLLPIGLNESTTSDVFEADLGREYEAAGNLYKLVKAGASIAAGSNSKVVEATVSSGKATGAVTLNVTTGNHYVAGVIPSTLTGAIAASAYFLALVQGNDLVLVTSSGSASITSGTGLISGTSSDLTMLLTGATSNQTVVPYCGFGLEATTGTSTVAKNVHFRAPFRFKVG